ncbi:hypothetical protein [Halocatena pleomorpha]|uniref:hypothetical protein n=1 Tax=Halocatena pleomorpha TaxID=1785090 RepID=UPI00163A7B16|nr:hypothetical protein [Halocatena pleomorpha]
MTVTEAWIYVPIILGIKPVKERSEWEPDAAATDLRGDVVDVLLASAQQYIDLDEVLLGRGFYSNGVYATIHDHDLLYTTPVPKYNDYETSTNLESCCNGGDHGPARVSCRPSP